MRPILRHFFFTCFALLSINISAAKIYWVGGTGNFNDSNHWSFVSGGQGGAKPPSATDDVYFDENSFPGQSMISFIGPTEVHDLVFSQYTPKIIFSGTQNEKIIIHGNLSLNSYIDDQFDGDIILNPTQTTTTIGFDLTRIKGNIYFDGNTNWILNSNVLADDNSTVYFKNGTFNLAKTGIYTGNLIASAGITINVAKSTFKIKNKFILPAGVTFNNTKSTIYANINDPNKFQVASGIFNQNTPLLREINSVASVCNITFVSSTQPTCFNVCDGTIVFQIPAATCSGNDSIIATWTNAAGCTFIPDTVFVPGNTPTTYSISGLCSSVNQYVVTFANNFNQDTIYYNPPGFSMANPAPPQVKAFVVKSQPKCFGSCNGYIVATVYNSGTFPLTSHWTSTTFTGTVSHAIPNSLYKDTLKNLCAGTYSLSLTDANGCVSTTSVTVLGQPTVVSHTITPSVLLCFNDCNGSVTENLSGGTAPYTFTWTPAGHVTTTASPNSTYSGLCAGTYTVRTKDANGCKDSATATIINPLQLTAVKSPVTGSVNINCLNTCDGTIGVTSVSGGTGTYTFSWAPAGGVVSSTANSSTYSGLCGTVAGKTYTCTITDGNNCTLTKTFTVTAPPALSHTITGTNPKCIVGQGVSVGSATVTESGGASPYVFSWAAAGGTQSAPGANPNTYSNIGPGTYTAYVTDFNGCKDSATIVINPASAVTGTITATTDPTCPNLNNGKLCVTAGGGVPGYAYNWSPIGGTGNCTTPTLTVTPGGTSNYSVVITDANTCTVSVTGTITSPPQATISSSVTNPMCFGVCNGSATLTPVGATPFSYAWSCTPTTTNTISGQCGGTTCNYTVTDGNGCKYNGSVPFVSPPAITATKSPLTGSVNINCLSVCDGTVGVTGVSGGTAPYTFSWAPAGGTVSSAANSSTYSNLCGTVAGKTYTCTITDFNGCAITKTFTVTTPTSLSHTITATAPNCNVGSTGSATVTESGGVSPYTFSWSSGTIGACASPKSCISNIGGGTYTVVITDFNSCSDTATVILTPPPVLTGTITTITNPTCPNLNNGKLCVTAGGGTPGYSYNWTPCTSGTCTNSCTPSTLTVTPGGTSVYSVTITDSKGCPIVVTGTMTSPPQATVTPSITNVQCGSAPCTGSATLAVAGGSGTFNYAWSCSPSITNSISGRCAGTSCTYTVTDAVTNCVYIGTVNFPAAPPVLTVSISATALNCAGDCNSVITSTVSGGTGSIAYTWTGTGANAVTPNTPGQNGMCAGNYTCEVSDANNCTQTATLTIVSPPALTVTLVPTQPSCGGVCDGSILATRSGGSGTYTLTSWSPSVAPNPPGTLNPTGLCGSLAPGTTYTLTVEDNKGCVGTGTTTLIQPSSLTVTVSSNSVTCNGLCNGTATATPSGGTGPYTYSWDALPYGPSASIAGLCVGPHTLDVKDTNGCSKTQIFNITEPAVITACVANIVNTCGPCTGSADASCTTGGTTPYTYTWSPTGGNAASANGLCLGNYTLTVGDVNNCPVSVATFTINHIVNINLFAVSQSVSCNNACDGTASATASGGTSPYNLVWTSSPTYSVVTSCAAPTCNATSLCPGTYVITATDAAGCTSSDSVLIANPPPLTVTPSQTDVKCFGTCTGSATVTPSGGTPAYTVVWSPMGTSGPTVSNLCPGTYTATVTDNNGCPATQTYTIVSSPQFTVASVSNNPLVCGASNGSIDVTASGGTAGYSFSWLPPGGVVTGSTPTSTLSAIPAGVYSVTITDTNGCDTTQQISLSDPGTQVVTVVTQSVSCFGTKDGASTVTATGVAPITITWPPAGPSAIGTLTVSGDSAGIYQVKTVDGNGCTVIVPDTIKGPSQIFDNSTLVPATCLTGACIKLAPTGGVGPPYTYTWDGVAGPDSMCGLATGTHTVVISDGTPCSQTYTYAINGANTPTLNVTSTNNTCSYTKNGTANGPVVGGTPAYTYTWTSSLTGVVASGSGVSSVINLASDVYTVVITDAGGCTTQQTFTITSPGAILPNLTFTNNLCNVAAQGNPCSGSASVAPSGGTPGTTGYTYTWITIAGNTPTVNGVCPGSYSVIVADSNLCKDTAAFVIADPTALTASISSTPPACFNNNCSGTATVTPSGGTGSAATYTVSWDGVPSPLSVSNLCGGQQYTVTVNDSNSCVNTQIFTPVSATQITAVTNTVSPRCIGDKNGSASATLSGGVSPYTFTWSPAGGTTNTASPASTYTNIGAGAYTVLYDDANNCLDSIQFVISNPSAPGLTSSVTSASCGVNNGAITITSTFGGTGPVSVLWLPASLGCGSSLSCGSLSAGIYSVQLTDSLGCKDTVLIPLSNPNGPDVDSVVTNVNCFNSCNGSIVENVVAGINVVTPYTFTWTPSSPGTITTGTNTSTLSNICPGVYIATVADSMNCQTSTSFTITQPPVITDVGNHTNATCVGINDGTINSMGSGGTPGTTGYVYSIDGGAFTSPPTFAGHVFTNVAVGSHTVCIKDSVGCINCFTITINPATAILSVVNSVNNNCAGSCNGSISLSSFGGGTAPYTTTWSNLQTGPAISNLCAGSYTATITDAAGCKAIDTVTITTPPAINPNTVVSSPACGLCNGTITIAPTGGVPSTLPPAYTYTWNTSSHTSSITNVCAGLYQVDITDSVGCVQTVQIPVSNPNSPSVTTTATSPVCGNTCSGVITTTVISASSVTYLWLPGGQTTSSISNLCPKPDSIYFVQVKDSLGCIATVSDTIHSGVILNLNVTVVNPGCAANNGFITTNVTGGSGTYTYAWIPGPASTPGIGPVAAGAYTVIVRDATSGCIDSLPIGLNSNANGPILTPTSTDALCNGMCSGTASVSIFGGTPTYTANWSNGQNDTTSITNLCPNNYVVTVTDAMGCVTTASVAVGQPNKLVASLPVVTQTKCFNDCNGSIFTIVSGGTPLYTYTWTPATVVDSGGSGLCAGNYSVMVMDANGCMISEFDTLINPPQLTITGTVTPASCNTTPDAAINTTTTGGTPSPTAPGYTYTWSGGSSATTPGLAGILVGNYSVIVSDSRNCKDSASFVVNSAVSITVNAGNDTTLCSVPSFVLNGDTTGATSMQWIELPNPPLNVIGTTLSVSVTPTPGSTTQYVLTAANAGCTASDTISVTMNTTPVPDAGSAITIFLGQQGVIGGSPTNPGGGTISWQPNLNISDTTAANPTVKPQVTTVYTVTVKNAAGCTGWDTVTVTVLPTFVIPNGFSPNGDGYNETWQIDYIYLFPNCEVEVYNRWGEQLFYSKGYNTPWAGKYQGKDVPVGTYYYVIRLNDKRFPDHFAGPLTILR
jgi:gliding motility-associated-like protein